MYIFAIVIINLINFLLCVFILRSNPHKKINRSFSAIIFLVILWSISLFLSDQIKGQAALFWNKFIFTVAFLQGAFLFYFGALFPFSIIKIEKIAKYFFLPFGILLSILSVSTNLIVEKIEFFDWGTNVEPGSLYGSFIGFMSISVIGMLIILIAKYKKSVGLERFQLRYMFLGMVLSAIVTLTTNMFLPLITGNNEFAKYGPLSMIFLIGFTTYAIIRHRLMDIRLVIKRTTVYVSTVILILLFALGLYGLELKYFKETVPPGVWGPIVLLVGLIIFDPLKKVFEGLANKYFFASLYNYQATLEKLARELTHSIDLDEIIDSIVKTIRDTMKLDRTGVLLFDEQTHNYEVRQTIGFTVANGISLVRNNFLTNYLLEKRQPVIYQELESLQNNGNGENSEIGKLKTNMKRIEASLCLPLIIKDKLIGIIVLGEKISRDAYTDEDLRLLESLGNQASVAIENARLYNNMEEIVEAKTKEVRQKNIHLEKLLKMRSEFLDITSHQLRTPTSVLIGILEMAMSGDLDRLPKERKLQQFSGAYLKARKLEQIISDLLRASELDSAPFELELKDFKEINLEEFLNRAISSKSMEAEKQQVKIFLKKPLPLSKIYGEERFLEEAFGNLLDNAIKYTPEENKQTGEKGEIVILVEKKDDYVVIKIKDNGIGIPKEEIKKLFEKFSRASNAKEMYTDGTGLGLFIVKEIIKGHKGKVEVESKLGQGSTFSVFLPIEAPA